MHIRTFLAPNLDSALAEIHDQMGPQAIVLHTRPLELGWRKWWTRDRIEVTAGVRSRSSPEPADGPRAGDTPEPTPSDADGSSQNEGGWEVHATRVSRSAQREDVEPVHPARVWARHVVEDQLIQAGVTPGEAAAWMRDACQAGDADSTGSASAGAAAPRNRSEHVLDGDAQDLDPDAIEQQTREQLARWLRAQLRVAAPLPTSLGHQAIVALVGACGVGKTTTLAKLGADQCLRQGRRVGFITLDTFRAAAVEQLAAYADAMRAPLEVVEAATDIPAALRKLKGIDLVLVDTPGQNPRAPAQLEQLDRFLRRLAPDQVQLVVDATAARQSVRDWLRAFDLLRPASVILSKLDQVDNPAAAVAPILAAQSPISYVTDGQQVPEDVARADLESLARRISGLAVDPQCGVSTCCEPAGESASDLAPMRSRETIAAPGPSRSGTPDRPCVIE